MKHLSGPLLVVCLIGCAFVPQLTTAHSIIICALALLFGFNQYLLHQKQPSISTEIEKLQSVLEAQIQKQKDLHDQQITKVEDELGKISMTIIRNSSPSSAKVSADRKIIF